VGRRASEPFRRDVRRDLVARERLLLETREALYDRLRRTLLLLHDLVLERPPAEEALLVAA